MPVPLPPELIVEGESSKKRSPATPFVHIAIAGLVAVITSSVVLLFDLAFEHYGGISPLALTILLVPAALIATLGGTVWYIVRKKSKFALLDLVPLTLIGLLAGWLPFICIKSFPQ